MAWVAFFICWLTLARHPFILSGMDNQTQAPLEDLQAINTAVEQILAQLQTLKGENEVLKQRMDALLAEKSQLMQKNDQARTRLEAMINRLKMLEQSA